MCMTNYKFLTIILLTTWIIFMTGTSYAQISEQIPSPKKQLDNGVAPHDVVCRDDLILVDRGMNNIACKKLNELFNTLNSLVASMNGVNPIFESLEYNVGLNNVPFSFSQSIV